MADTAFETLEAARRLEAADIQAEQADAIVEVVNQTASQMVTVERFDTGVTGLHARIDSVHSELSTRIGSVHSELGTRIDTVHSDLRTRIDSAHSELSARIDSVQAELLARIDSVRAELREEFANSHLKTLIVVIAANTLIAAILGILLSGGAPVTLSFGSP